MVEETVTVEATVTRPQARQDGTTDRICDRIRSSLSDNTHEEGLPVGSADPEFDNGYRHRYLPQALTRDMRVDGPAHPDLDPDHHLWKNGTRWWIAITLHAPDWKKSRLRRSLGTADIREARRRRDAILRYFERSTDFDLSLRYARQFA